MNKLALIQKNLMKEKLPPVSTGDIVRVYTKFKEKGEEKTAIFEGVVISVKGAGINKNITVRKIAAGVGVERIFPLHSPVVSKIEIRSSHKVRRAKLYYLRKITGSAGKLKEKAMAKDVLDLIEAQKEEEKRLKEEAIKKEKKEEKPAEKEEKKEENGKKKIEDQEKEEKQAEGPENKVNQKIKDSQNKSGAQPQK